MESTDEQRQWPERAELHPAEWAFADSRPRRRRTEFVAGRRALRLALTQVGWVGGGALLVGPQGRPVLPDDFTASLTHKDGFAYAIAARAEHGWSLGIDCEVVGLRDRNLIARKVLRSAERDRWEAAGGQWRTLLELFSTKEAIYKALHPHVPRYIGFDEAEIEAEGGIRLHLTGGEGPFLMERHLSWQGDRLLAAVRAKPRG